MDSTVVLPPAFILSRDENASTQLTATYHENAKPITFFVRWSAMVLQKQQYDDDDDEKKCYIIFFPASKAAASLF